MISNALWVKGSRHFVRYKLPPMQTYVCARCVRSQQRSLATIASLSTRLRNGCVNRSASSHVSKRALHDEQQAASWNPESRSAIDEILLKTEFESNKDIRQYLRKWQETQDNSLDPVRGPGTSNPPQVGDIWVGNMLNDSREAYDHGGDSMRADENEEADLSITVDEGTGVHHFLEPGDLVGLSSANGTLTLAIYIRSIEKQQQFYTSRGKWRIASNRDLDYVFKGFASKELVQKLHPYVPDHLVDVNVEMQTILEGGVPRPLGAPLLRLLEVFEQQARDFYMGYCSQLDNIYSHIAHEEDQVEFTIRELASRALNMVESELTPAMLLVVHRAVTKHPFFIDYDRTSVFTDHYLVQPKRIANLIETVGKWVREHQEHLIQNVLGEEKHFKDHPLQLFIQKARRLIRLSRNVRSPTTMANVGPSGQRLLPAETKDGRIYREVPTEEFSDTDKMIIEYLQLYCIPPQRMTEGILRYAGAHIMRATGMYSTILLDAGHVALLLQELGVISPWENLNLLDQTLGLPGHGTSAQSEALFRDAWRAAEEMKDQEMVDKMKDLRTDWGDLPVYCVDDADANEIDDGVSVEPVPGSSDTYWVRIHVANPSAFISHDSKITQYAANRLESLYTPDRVYPTMSDSLTQRHFSLAPGRPTLTISAKINTYGQILETDITNGYIRNVIYLTHAKLREFFDAGPKSAPKTLVVGGELPRRSREGLREVLTEQDKTNFRILRQVMLGFRNQLKKNGALSWPPNMEIPVSVFSGTSRSPQHRLDAERGRYFVGDPVIAIDCRDVDPHEIPDLTKQNLISTVMNFACFIVGQWCADRNIPVIYDGTWYHPEYSKLTSENAAEYGGKGFYSIASPKGVSSSSVVSHSTLGMDAYLKVTSPLRRFCDTLAHYQIEAALRYEKQSGQKFDASQHSSVLPFTRDEVEKIIDRSRWLRPRKRMCDVASLQFWACMLLFRAFYFNECKLPETFPCIVHQKLSPLTTQAMDRRDSYVAYIIPLGVRCRLFTPPGYEQLDIFSIVDAKISAVDMSKKAVVMDVVRRVRPFSRHGEWA